MDNNKVNELLANEDFIASLSNAESADEMIQLFADNDVEITADELQALVDESGELSDDDLDDVSGGAAVATSLSKKAALQSKASQGLAKISAGLSQKATGLAKKAAGQAKTAGELSKASKKLSQYTNSNSFLDL